MQGLTLVKEYLLAKVDKININNPKANTGGKILKLHKTLDEDIEKLITIALQTIQMRFTYDTSDSPAGTAPLTAVSTAIGNRIHSVIKREPVPWSMHIRLGDLFVEAFYNCGYIDLYYPKARDTSYIISATARWIELADLPETTTRIALHGTLTERPQPINNIIQEHGEPVIKGWTEENNKLFQTYLDTPWVNAVNKLQQTGWRINRRVLEALERDKDTFISNEPILDNDAKEQKRRSKKVEWGFIIAKANLLKEEDKFYQLLEADYRGRLYYSETFLNFQGSDLARGMLNFARAKPMTEDGLQWLAIHTASSFNQSFGKDEIPSWCEGDYKSLLEEEGLESISVDKMTLEDRIRWTNVHMDILLEAGRDNLFIDGAEKAVSVLACCIEWYDYQQAQLDNRMHMTRLPIPIDGSNNGWQHLGAISKDPKTGDLVGLIPREIQQDFYVQTAKKLNDLTTHEERKEILTSMPMKHIRKGISKRGSMTRAYSAGASKIAENMWFDCKAEDFHEKYGLTEDHCKGFAKDLITAINQVCPGPLDTMSYFQALAKFEIGEHQKFGPDGKAAGPEYNKLRKEIKDLYFLKDKTEEDIQKINDIALELQTYESRLVYGNGKDRIRWTTPSKFPVEYVNFVTRDEKCHGTISGFKTAAGGSKTIKHVAQVPTKMPDTRGFMCGISPNFVHSLDASHMALVIDDWNNEFGAVHDSFSTHACDVESLLALTKDKFIDMYNVDNFYDYIENELVTDKTYLDVTQPNRGSLNVEDIYQSDYFFA